jgi:hypothetical protein
MRNGYSLYSGQRELGIGGGVLGKESAGASTYAPIPARLIPRVN